MFRLGFHSVVNAIDSSVPRGVKQYIKRQSPALVERFYQGLARHTSDDVVEVTVKAGPLQRRTFFCSLKHQRSCYLGNFEPLKERTLQRHLRGGDVFFDVGGHIGYFSFVAALLVRPTGKVVAFEPSPKNAAQFRQNLMANGDLAAFVELHELAIADTTITKSFALGANSYVGHLAEPNDPGTVDVHVTTLDEFARASGTWPDFVKVDAEGAEPRIFAGMQEVFRRSRPKVLVELHDDSGYSSLRRLVDEHAYVSRRIDSDEAFSQEPSWVAESEYLAVPRERLSDAV